MLHVIGVVPVAVSVWLYAVPTVPPGNDVVVIVGAVPVLSPGVVPGVLPLGVELLPSPPPQAAKENPVTATRAIMLNIFAKFFIQNSFFVLLLMEREFRFHKETWIFFNYSEET
jgi:hypothetical protein